MHIKKIELTKFKRFHKLTINVPSTPKLVVMAGPNGCEKSSLYEALNVWHRTNAGWGVGLDAAYYPKTDDTEYVQFNWQEKFRVEMHEAPADQIAKRKAVYIRSAYRNDPQFALETIQRRGKAVDEFRLQRLIDNDATVAFNYQRLASQALEDVFAGDIGAMTVEDFRQMVVGDIRSAMSRVFPDLLLNDLGNPLVAGTFRFDKGSSHHFLYQNLSGGEKAAFDLLLDIVVKRREFDDSVYCIDEPEAHMNTRLQASLLNELVGVLPDKCQMWIATHSIGMMRKARDIENNHPGSVVFLDFSDLDFDQPQTINPTNASRAFWERTLSVALDDLSSLVAPSAVIVCEGSPSGTAGKNESFDARCYNKICEAEFPDTRFVSAGNASDVKSDRLAIASSIQALVRGCSVFRLIDRDDHSPEDIEKMKSEGVRVLSRRHLESYLYDDEILGILCASIGKSDLLPTVLQDKKDALNESITRANAADDWKSASGALYTKLRQRLGLTGMGNDARSFAVATLAPLVTPNTATYQELRMAVMKS